MRNKLVAAAITGLVAAPSAHAAADVSWFGFNQITASTVDDGDNPINSVTGTEGSGFAFGADRIRIGYKAQFDSGAHSKLQLDFNTSGTNQLPNVIKDAVVGYDFGTVDVQAGMRKTPIGMDFNTSGKKLDIVNRGMEKNYVLERTAGAYVFGDAGPIGYAAFIGNPASRSGAVPGSNNFTDATGDANPSLGADSSYGARVSYGMGKMLHAELSYGMSTVDSNAPTAEDYTVMDIGVKSQPMPGLTLKAEYLQGSNVNHTDGRDQTVMYVHGGYEFTPMLEGVVRHYQSTASTDGTFGNGEDSDTLSNTYLGLNVFLNPEKHHEARIQINYILPGGDTDTGNLNLHRNGSSVDDAGEASSKIKAMFQTSF